MGFDIIDVKPLSCGCVVTQKSHDFLNYNTDEVELCADCRLKQEKCKEENEKKRLEYTHKLNEHIKEIGKIKKSNRVPLSKLIERCSLDKVSGRKRILSNSRLVEILFIEKNKNRYYCDAGRLTAINPSLFNL